MAIGACMSKLPIRPQDALHELVGSGFIVRRRLRGSVQLPAFAALGERYPSCA
jgi:hypothetical protein